MVEEGGSPSPAEGALFLLPRFPPPALQPLSPSFTPAATSTRAGPLPPFHLTPPPPTSCRPLYYFLLPSYWIPSLGSGHALKSIHEGPRQDVSELVDDDVAEEESKVRALLNHRTGKGRGGAAGDMGGRGCMGMGRGLEAEEWSANVMV